MTSVIENMASDHKDSSTALVVLLIISLLRGAASEILTIKSVFQETNYCMGTPDALGTNKICRINCPNRRPKPDVEIINPKTRIYLPDSCITMSASSDITSAPMDEGGLSASDYNDYIYKTQNCEETRQTSNCFKDLFFEQAGGDYTFSIALSTGIKNTRQQLMKWATLSLDVYLETNGSLSVYVLRTDGQEIHFMTTSRVNVTRIHMLIAVTSMVHIGHGPPTIVPSITINDKMVPSITQSRQKLTDEERPPLPLNSIRVGSPNSIGNAYPFFGTVYSLDVFRRIIEPRESDAEYKYTQYLKPDYNGYSYEYTCVCPYGTSPTSGDNCSDGSNRFGFTGDRRNQYFFPPDAINSIPVPNSAPNTGLWLATPGHPLRLSLDKPAVLTSIKIFAMRQRVILTAIEDETDEFPIVCIEDSNMICKDYESSAYARGSVSWRENPFSKSLNVSVLTWRAHQEDLLVVKRLRIDFNLTSLSPTPRFVAGENPIYSIALEGRFLDSDTRPGKCACFPGNSIDHTQCDECGVCTCSATTTLADIHCRPHVSEIEPDYGPTAGGTRVTITGELLQPYPDSRNASVLLGHKNECIVEKSNDTTIVCITGTTNESANRPLGVTVEVGVGFTRYMVPSELHFAYKPNPIIENVKPFKTILYGGIHVTVEGQHLNSVYIRSTDRILTLHLYTLDGRTVGYEQRKGTCEVRNKTIMICEIPQINIPRDQFNLSRRKRSLQRRESVQHIFEADVGLILDGVKKYANLSAALPSLGRLKIFRDPEFDSFSPKVKVFRPYNGDETLEITGRRFTLGCQEDDYNILLQGKDCEEYCKLETLYDNYLVCRPPQMLRTVCGNEPLMVVVRVGLLQNVVGHIQYEKTILENTLFVSGLVGGIVSFIVFVIICISICWGLKYRRAQQQAKKKKSIEMSYAHLNRTDYQALIAQEPDSPEPFLELLTLDMRDIVERSLLDQSKLTILNEIGQGNFGTVFRGTLYSDDRKQDVAVKTLRDDSVSNRELCEFLEEATIMKDFQHPNVLSLLGVVIRKGRVYVVLPFMAKGDLKKLVAKTPFNVLKFTSYAHDAAKGMAYLATQKFIHRDLAARNCMVGDSDEVVVADFGLARDIYEKDYYRLEEKMRPLPAKWMALESLQGQTFSSKSDVWSFGVLMWEIFTNGRKPYAHVDNYLLRDYLQRGHRLEKPDGCPEEIWGLMTQCWQSDSDKRPSFEALATHLKVVMQKFSSSSVLSHGAGNYDDIQVTNDSSNNKQNQEPVIARERQSNRPAAYRVHSVPNDYTGTPMEDIKKPVFPSKVSSVQQSDDPDMDYFTPVDPCDIYSEAQTEEGISAPLDGNKNIQDQFDGNAFPHPNDESGPRLEVEDYLVPSSGTADDYLAPTPSQERRYINQGVYSNENYGKPPYVNSGCVITDESKDDDSLPRNDITAEDQSTSNKQSTDPAESSSVQNIISTAL